MRADGDDGDGNDHGDDNDQWSLTMILVMMMMIMAMMMETIVMRHTNMTDGTGKEQELSDFKMLTLIGRYTWTDCKLGGKVQNEEMCFSYGSTGYNKVGAEAVARFLLIELCQQQFSLMVRGSGKVFFSSNYANNNIHSWIFSNFH